MSWNDEKIDALDKKVDAGFANMEKRMEVESVRNDERFKAVGERFDELNGRFDRFEERFDGYQRTFLQVLGGLLGTVILALITMLVAILG